MRDIESLIVHCSATPEHHDADAKEIRTWHLERGWDDIGYHYVIKRDGTIEFGRPVHKIGAHVRNHNEFTLGVCLIGGVGILGRAENNFTLAQFAALKILVQFLRQCYPTIEVKGHRDLLPTHTKECPSFSVRDWLVKESLS